jgi:hypothetical protein
VPFVPLISPRRPPAKVLSARSRLISTLSFSSHFLSLSLSLLGRRFRLVATTLDIASATRTREGTAWELERQSKTRQMHGHRCEIGYILRARPRLRSRAEAKEKDGGSSASCPDGVRVGVSCARRSLQDPGREKALF